MLFLPGKHTRGNTLQHLYHQKVTIFKTTVYDNIVGLPPCNLHRTEGKLVVFQKIDKLLFIERLPGNNKGLGNVESGDGCLQKNPVIEVLIS